MKNDQVWIIMEYFSCGSLSNIIKFIQRPLTEIEIAFVLKDII